MGLLAGCVAVFFFVPSLIVCLLFIAVMVLDGFIQLKTRYESTNIRRLVTGLLFGYAIIPILVIVTKGLISKM